jgi:hypothetical protein
MLIDFINDFLFNICEEVADLLFWVEVGDGVGELLYGGRRFFTESLFGTLLCFRGHYFIFVGCLIYFGLYYKGMVRLNGVIYNEQSIIGFGKRKDNKNQ